MSNTLRYFVISSLFFISVTYSVFAQESTSATFCNSSDIYNIVEIDIEPSVPSAVTGTPITFSGLIKNRNSFPIVDGKVYVKIFKIGKNVTVPQQVDRLVVDEFFVAESLSISEKSEEPIVFDWNIPAFAMSGEYEAIVYFVTSKSFNSNKVPFDYSSGSKAVFLVTAGGESGVELEESSILLNGNQYFITSKPLKLKVEDSIDVEVKLKNSTNEPQVVVLTWTLSNWGSDRKGAEFNQKFETITLKPNEIKAFNYESNQSAEAMTLLKVESKWQETKSILDIYFVREGFDESGFNISGVSNYPLIKGEESVVFACLYSTDLPTIQDSELTLALIDNQGKTLHSYTESGVVVGSVSEIRNEFKPKETIMDFTLVATLKSKGVVVEEIFQNYSCQEINSALCQANLQGSKETAGFISSLSSINVAISSLIVLFLFYFTRKLKRETVRFAPLSLMLVAFSTALLFGYGVNSAAAATAPNMPTVTASGANNYQVGTIQSFSLNATDADGDIIRYGIDWDNNGSVDQWVPGAGYVNSGFNQTANRIWATAGTYTFRVQTQDNNNLNSSWRLHTVTINSPIAQPSPATASISAAPACFISIGNSSCTGTIIWSSGNTTAPSIRQNGIQFSTAVSSSLLGVSRTLTHGTHLFTFVNGTSTLASVTVNAICFGSTWNGSVCASSASISASITAPDCTIVAGESSCVADVVWNTSGITSPSVRQNGVPFSGAVSNSGVSRTIGYGTNTFTIYDGVTQRAIDTATASCGGSSLWNGLICEGVLPVAPILSLIATPNTITAGDFATLKWTVTGAADSCWASGGWTGWVTHSGTDTQIVSPSVTTTYTLECYNAGVSSGQQSQTITVNAPATPTANISGTTCDIPLYGSTCMGTLTWDIQNTVSPNVHNLSHSYTYSNSDGENSFPAQFWYGVNDVWARDNTNNLATTNPSPFVIDCVPGSNWNSTLAICDEIINQTPILSPVVVIDVTTNPTLIRSGATTNVSITINAAHPLNCVLLNAQSAAKNFTHAGGSTTHSFTTRPLFSAQMVTVNCVSSLDANVTGTDTARVNVAGILQEV